MLTGRPGGGVVVGGVVTPPLPPHAPTDTAKMIEVKSIELDERTWRILVALKREFSADEISDSPWLARADEAGVAFEEFCATAESLNKRGIIGRFSTFLEHVKPSQGGVRVTRFNGLFHWAVPPGREIEAGGARRAGRASTGLGLPISRELVRKMGGEITVSSLPGAGTTFLVSLPPAA